jgi:SsrA-binding protein
MPPPRTKPVAGHKVVATNRQARRDFDILDTYECGLVLRGSEVKSLREGKVQLAEAHARIIRGEAFVFGLHISPYSHAHGADGHNPDRERKLLLHREEIAKLSARMEQERLTLVPLALYFDDGRAKLEIGVGRGRRKVDKRQLLAKRDATREVERASASMRRHR